MGMAHTFMSTKLWIKRQDATMASIFSMLLFFCKYLRREPLPRFLHAFLQMRSETIVVYWGLCRVRNSKEGGSFRGTKTDVYIIKFWFYATKRNIQRHFGMALKPVSVETVQLGVLRQTLLVMMFDLTEDDENSVTKKKRQHFYYVLKANRGSNHFNAKSISLFTFDVPLTWRPRHINPAGAHSWPWRARTASTIVNFEFAT